MILPDVNLLIHSYDTRCSEHIAAKAWWEQAMNETSPVGLAWAVILGFLRITTSARVMEAPFRPTQATAIVRTWLERPHVQIVTPGDRHAEILLGILDRIGTAGNLTTDAHLAALAVEYRGQVATADADFARFSGVRHFNPLRLRRR